MGSNLKELADAACRGQTLHQTKPTIQKGSKQQIKKSERERERERTERAGKKRLQMARSHEISIGQSECDLLFIAVNLRLWPMVCPTKQCRKRQGFRASTAVGRTHGAFVCLHGAPWPKRGSQIQPDPTRSNQISHRSNPTNVRSLQTSSDILHTDASEACHVAG